MAIILTLLIAGLLLISLEVFLPGGILGLIGAILMIGGCFKAYQDFGYVGAAYTTIAGGILLVILLFVEFKILAKTKFGERLFLNKSVSGGTSPAEEKRFRERESLVGKTGVTATVLAPTGLVEIDGKSYEAQSESGLIRPGHEVRVVSQDSFRLVVRAL